jgi:hypothetical protein
LLTCFKECWLANITYYFQFTMDATKICITLIFLLLFFDKVKSYILEVIRVLPDLIKTKNFRIFIHPNSHVIESDSHTNLFIFWICQVFRLSKSNSLEYSDKLVSHNPLSSYRQKWSLTKRRDSFWNANYRRLVTLFKLRHDCDKF